MSCQNLQCITSRFTEVVRLLGLADRRTPTSLYLEKSSPLYIILGVTASKDVHRFVSVGNNITSDTKIDKEVVTRQAKMSCTFCRRHKLVWYSRHAKKGSKIRVYRAIVIITLLYDSDLWVSVV